MVNPLRKKVNILIRNAKPSYLERLSNRYPVLAQPSGNAGY